VKEGMSHRWQAIRHLHAFQSGEDVQGLLDHLVWGEGKRQLGEVWGKRDKDFLDWGEGTVKN